MIVGAFVGVLAGVTASPQFGAEDPLQHVDRAAWYHRSLTQEAALRLGWAAGAAGEIAWHAVGVDLYAYHLPWRLIGGPRRWRGARWSRTALTRLHFDNLPTSADVEEIWSRVLGGTQVALNWSCRHGDVHAARQAIGAGLHAIQDFYSHSTWINAPSRRDGTWLGFRGEADVHDLSTGGYGAGHPGPFAHGRIALTAHALLRLPGMVRPGRTPSPGSPGEAAAVGPTPPGPVPSGSTLPSGPPAGSPPPGPASAGPPPGLRHAGPAGINLDSRWQAQAGTLARRLADLDGDAAFDLALDLAARDTCTWLADLDSRNSAGPRAPFWHRVRTEPARDWTDAYERPTALCYQFLSAGRDLPAGRGDAHRWFLRIDLTPGTHDLVAVQVMAADGRLLAVARPPRRAITVGPLPADAAAVRVLRSGTHGWVQVHAFRRAPEPELRLVLDDAATGRGGASCAAGPVPLGFAPSP